MKATQVIPPAFSPVHITLETQAEVDALYAILNHAWVTDAPLIKLALGGSSHEKIMRFTSDAKFRMYEDLCEYIKSKAEQENAP